MTNPAPYPTKYRAKFTRSKHGCYGCRARRKRCDGKRPICAMCARKVETCQWPVADRFVSASASGHASHAANGPSIIGETGNGMQKYVARRQSNITNPLSNHFTDVKSPEHGSWPCDLVATTLSSPATARSQIRSLAAVLFGPDTSSRAYSPFWTILPLSTDSDDSFTLAFDALALAQLGTFHKDNRLLRQAVKSYFGSIRKLQAELGSIAANTPFPDTLLSTPYLLLLCGRFSLASPLNNSSGMSVHLLGLFQMLKLRENSQTRLRLLLLDDFYTYALEWSILTRQKLCHSLQQITAGVTDTMPSYCPGLMAHIIKTPDLLERVRDLSLHATTYVHCDARFTVRNSKLLQDLEQHETELLACFQAWTAMDSSSCYSTVPASALLSHNSRLDELSAALFGTAFSFLSFAAARLFRRFWQYIHIVRNAQYEITALLSPQSSDDVQTFRQCAIDLADDICRAVIYLCASTENGSHGFYCAAGAVQYLRQWFLSEVEVEKVAWCDAVLGFLRDRHVNLAIHDE